MKKVCVVTGSRSEYGLLYPLLKKLKAQKELKLQIVVCGMHLAAEFGSTYKEILNDGFRINRKVKIPLSDDQDGVAKAISSALIGFSRVFRSLSPDMIVLLGDRFETFAAAIAAFTIGIPIAHIHGGELTEGVIDDALRHSITKMSFLHFAATEVYRRRIIQLGEEPVRVFNVGALAIDNILHSAFLDRTGLEKELGFMFGSRTALVTFHPVTLEKNSSAKQFQELLDALDSFKDLKVIFTLPNADPGNGDIRRLIDHYVRKHQGKAIAFASLGRVRYLSLMRCVDVVVGNSSSGIIEAPSFGVPTVNIGDRQEGRIKARNIIDCPPCEGSIKQALHKAFSPGFRHICRKVTTPYGTGKAAGQITQIIKKKIGKINNTKKPFHNLN